jgi:protein tyrosine phosphatase (PTP) superfamily phosphohydrolase (DUF442 family)
MQLVLETSPPRAKTQAFQAPHAFRLKRRKRVRLALLMLVIMVGLGVTEAIRVLAGRNFHIVVPGRVYRGAQPSTPELERLVRDYGIKTVVNLRGVGMPSPWYREQCRTVQRLGVSMEDICLSAGRLPSMQELRRLLEILERTEYPIYVHCWRGVDRTGLVATIVLLSQPGVPLEEARRQLSLRYGHLPLGRPAHLDEFFDLYESWLRETGNEHTPDRFRRWVLEDYQGGWYRRQWERCERLSKPRLGEPIAYQVRVRNTSARPWRLSPHSVSGIHVVFRLRNDDGEIASGRAGLRAGQVAPGDVFETTLVVPPIRQPGRYLLFVDLVDPQHGWFFQMGSELVTEELHIGE